MSIYIFNFWMCLRRVAFLLKKTTKSKIGILHLEEDNGTTVKSLAGYQRKVPAVLPDSGEPKYT